MQRQIQHQTIFVAALSVYLGLLIVGAPPQVLAQVAAATAQQSQANKSDEAEKELAAFTSKLKELAQSGKLNSFDLTIRTQFENQKVSKSQVIVTQGDKELTSLLQKFAPSIIERYLGQVSPKQVEWILRGDNSDFKSNITLNFESPRRAQMAASGYNSLLAVVRFQRKGKTEAVLLDQVNITPENDQVFIVTRLPRAALDSLLKANEKAN